MDYSSFNPEGRFLNPFIDEGFKRLFGSEGSKPFLLFFLNSLFNGNPEIVDVKFDNTEKLPEVPGGRKIIHDIFCTTSGGEHLIVEMQNERHTNFEKRSLYYMSGAISRQGQKGSAWNFDVKAVYGIFFCDFNIEADSDELISDYVIKNKHTGKQFTDRWRMIFINLPRMTRTAEECGTDLEKFIYVFKNMPTMETMPYIQGDNIWKELSDWSEVSKLQGADYDRYMYALNQARISRIHETDVLNRGIAKGIAKGEAIGITKGEAIGIAKGEAIGIAKGEAKKEAQMILNMAKEGLGIETIAKFAGIAIDKVRKILDRR